MRKYTLGLILLLAEYGILILICIAMNCSSDYTFRFMFLYLMLQTLFGHYRMKTVLVWEEMRLLANSHACFYLASLILIPIVYLDMNTMASNLAITLIMLCIDIILSRQLRILMRAQVADRVLIIGTGKEAASLYDICITNRFSLMKIIAFIQVDATKDPRLNSLSAAMVIDLKQMEEVLIKQEITQVVVAVPDMSKSQLDDIMNIVKKHVGSVKYIPKVNGLVTFDSHVEDFDGLLVISRSDKSRKLLKQALKRLVDILGGMAGCVCVLPLYLYVRHVNRRHHDDGPVFFKQQRIGQDGKLFQMYKFRTMVPDAEQLLVTLMEEHEEIRIEYQTNKKLRNDPRITSAGKFLRAKSLDEFPQLLNVLKGEMSLVGPRPYLPREQEDMGAYYHSIIGCKPGITGMWQSHGRNDVGFLDRCEMDDYYYHNWSLWLDITILVKTVKSVMHHEGAL